MWGRGRIGCALACAVATFGVATPALALEVGISDQRTGVLDDRRIGELPIDRARLVVSWDVAIARPTGVDAWLRRAAQRRLTPHIAFEKQPGCDAACPRPSSDEYAAAFAAFRARWPGVREFTPWNEPNHPDQPTSGSPAAAAAFHDVLRRACPECTVVAGDVLDNSSMKTWFAEYRAALNEPPMAWGIHNYGDVSYGRPSYTEWLLDQVTGPVWVTETGGIVRFASGGTVHLPYDEARAAASVDRALDLALAHPDRIPRLYVYQWQAAPGDDFDAGLVRTDGSARPSLERLQARLGTREWLPDEPDPSPGASGPEPRLVPANATPSDEVAPLGAIETFGAAPLRIARPSRVKGGLRIPVTCPAERGSRCRGTVAAFLGGETLKRERALGMKRIELGPGQHVVRIALTRHIRRIWNRQKTFRLRTVSALRDPPGVEERAWRVLAR